MIVEITLRRNDGSPVLKVSGNAFDTVFWTAVGENYLLDDPPSDKLEQNRTKT